MIADERGTLPVAGAPDVLYVIDLFNFLFRAYHAMPPMHAASGEPTHATLGTLNMILRIVEDQRPQYLAVAMDSPGLGFRGELAPSYKAHRPRAPEDLVVQIERSREIFEAYGVPIFREDGFEADDLIATLVRHGRAAGLRVVVASSDKDLLQLVGADVVMWDAMRNKVFGPLEVREKFGVGPELVRDLLALVGDTSDNVAGIAGVGPKTAAQLLTRFGSLDELCRRIGEIDRPKLRLALETGAETLALAVQLVTLKDDLAIAFELETLAWGRPDLPRLRALFTELHFSRLLAKLESAPPIEGPAKVLHAPANPDPRRFAAITTMPELDELCVAIAASGRVAITAFGAEDEPMRTSLVGLALSPAIGHAAYVPVGHRALFDAGKVSAMLPLTAVLERLRPLLEDARIAKVGHDLKRTEVLLARHGVALAGLVFDTMLASYLFDPDLAHKLEFIAERDAGISWTALTPAPRATKGRPLESLAEREISTVAPFACAYTDAIEELERTYRGRLVDDQLASVFHDLEMPLSHVLAQMELVGVAMDRAPLAVLAVELERDLAALVVQAHGAAGREFNLGSPRQLETILFDELGLRPTKKTKTGRSTDAEALEALEDAHALPGIALAHRSLAKLKGTYVDTLPQLLHSETGRIHTHWEQAVAATGRISSRDPNLQNIPVRSPHGKRIREAFVAPKGSLILSADYSQIELRVLAHLSEDPVLVGAFERAEDVHVRTAMTVFGVDEAQVTSEMRAQSKTVNFGVLYGMGALALAKRLRITRAAAKQFIDTYFERHDGVRRFLAATLEAAQKTGCVRTMLGRRRMLPELNSKNHNQRAYAERVAQNTPIQGTAADILKLAMVKLAEPVVPGARMVLTVHDELVFEIPEEHIERAAKLIRQTMESVLPLRVPLVVDVGWGRSWADCG
ncbi:MAG: DNA polymerase I [Myxococcales bacterium]|nr:DNA polymerase I [Myxococcales bacterium]